MSPRITASLVLASASILNTGASAGFVAGDVYLVSASLPGAGGLSTPGIYRYRPSTGENGVWLPLPNGSFGPGSVLAASGATYDPYRDRLLLTLSGGKLGVVADDGALSTITVPAISFQLCVPGPNGIAYLVASSSIHYVDAANTVHELLAPGGASISLTGVGVNTTSSAIFDVDTSSLIIAGVGAGPTRFARISLDASGTQAAGQPTTTDVDLVAGQVEVVAGMSAGPSGSLFVTIDINANGTFAQLQTINPVSFSHSTFATTSDFLNAGATTGTWLPTSGVGLLLDTAGDVLRAYPQGSSGPGTIVGVGASSGGGSAEAARLIAIGATINGTPDVTGDLDGDGHVGAADIAVLLGAWGPCGNCSDCPADLDGDCSVSAADLSILLGNWG